MLILHVTSHQYWFYTSCHMLILHVMSHQCWFYTSCRTNAGSTRHVTSMLVLHIMSHANSTRHVAPMLVLHVMSHQCWFYTSCHMLILHVMLHQCWFYTSCHTYDGWTRQVKHLLILHVIVTGSTHHITNTSVSIINLSVTCSLGELRMYPEHKQMYIPCSNYPFYRILQKSAQLLCSETCMVNSGWLFLVTVVYPNIPQPC